MQLETVLKPFAQFPETRLLADITSVTLNSQQVKPGSLFIALHRGVEYIPDAIANGALAVLVDGDLHCDSQADAFIISIPMLQQIYGDIASYFYGHPSKKLTIIGITGTNGKTSVSHYIAQLMQYCGRRCGIIGTLGVGEIDDLQPTGLTTPDAVTVHHTLKKFVDNGITDVAMEVSSHALAQHRVQGVAFDVAVFTNLSHDHLDYHGNMQQYFSEKQKLFVDYGIKHAVINSDDQYGQQLSDVSEHVLTYSTRKNADISAAQILFSEQGIAAKVSSPWGAGDVELPLLGEFNLSNILASIAAVSCCNVTFNDCLMAANTLQAVAGRMQCFRAINKPLVIVDYAHTPDALTKALQAINVHCQGDIWCVFGCGGNRDRDKRAVMARVAEAQVQHIVLTNDNPRHEDPQQILDDIIAGFVLIKPHVEPDRATAIAYAIEQANSHDTVLIAGKGHENYQLLGDQKIYFSDSDCVESLLNSINKK